MLAIYLSLLRLSQRINVPATLQLMLVDANQIELAPLNLTDIGATMQFRTADLLARSDTATLPYDAALP